MCDVDYLARFEAGTLANEDCHHSDHVKVVWLYLRRYPVLEALHCFTTGLKHFAAAHGKTNLYHETITWAFAFLIHERMRRADVEQSWEGFAEANADLL